MRRASIAGVLAALALGAFAATAEARTTGFYVYNLTGGPLELYDVSTNTRFSDDGDAPRRPRKGDVLMPGADGDHNHFELEFVRRGVCPSFNCDYSNSASLFYRKVGTTPSLNQSLGLFLSDGFDGFVRYPSIDCIYAARCTHLESNTAAIVDPPGTVNVVKGNDIQEQARVLRQLCNEKNVDKDFVDCEFEHKDRRHTVGDSHLVGGTVLGNCTEEDVEIDDKFTDIVGTETSYGQKISTELEVKIPPAVVVKNAIELKFEEAYKTEHEFEHSARYTIKPGHLGYLVHAAPVIRDIGDFTLEIGNTKFKLPDVHFDTPDTTKKAAIASVFVPKTPQMTATQKADLCEGDSDPIVIPSAPHGFASLEQRGVRGADVLFGGPESTTLIGRGGGDLLLGAAGDDRLLGGSGRDVYRAGPGSDKIIDSQGRTRAFTGAGGRDGPDSVDVRDGEDDDAVTCSKDESLVEADPGDRVRGCG